MKIQNGCHMWEQEIFFENFQEYTAQIPCESKISRTVREIEANLCFAKFLAKIQNAAIFGEGKFFFVFFHFLAKIRKYIFREGKFFFDKRRVPVNGHCVS